jgi:hypothetical protein
MFDLKGFLLTAGGAEKLKYHVEHIRCMMGEGGIEGVKIGKN